LRKHIEDQSAARRFAIIPARPLRWVGRAIEHPPAEIEPDRQDPAKEIGLVKLAQFDEPRQEQFVLHDAAFEAGALGAARQVERITQCFGERLFDIDVLGGLKCRGGAGRPAACGAGVEIDGNIAVGEARVAVGAPFEPAIARGQRRQLCRVAPEQYRVRHKAVAIAERKPAFIADRHQRPQMLGRAEPSGRPLYNNADRACRHLTRSPQ